MIIEEAERLLNGTSFPLHRNEEVSVWMVVGTLAHAERSRLRKAAIAAIDAHPGSWRSTYGVLASKLLALADTDDRLRLVQRQTLVPIELRLLGGQLPVPASPSGLARLIGNAIEKQELRPDC